MSDTENIPAVSAGTVLTTAEIKMVAAVIKNVKGGKLDVDMDAVAVETGMKDSRVATARWNTIKRNKLSNLSAPAGGVDKTTPTKKNATPKKATAEAGDTEKPKAKRGRPTKAEKAAKEAATKETEKEASDRVEAAEALLALSGEAKVKQEETNEPELEPESEPAIKADE